MANVGYKNSSPIPANVLSTNLKQNGGRWQPTAITVAISCVQLLVFFNVLLKLIDVFNDR